MHDKDRRGPIPKEMMVIGVLNHHPIWVDQHHRVVLHVAVNVPGLRLLKVLIPRWIGGCEPPIHRQIEARLHVDEAGWIRLLGP